MQLFPDKIFLQLSSVKYTYNYNSNKLEVQPPFLAKQSASSDEQRDFARVLQMLAKMPIFPVPDGVRMNRANIAETLQNFAMKLDASITDFNPYDILEKDLDIFQNETLPKVKLPLTYEVWGPYLSE